MGINILRMALAILVPPILSEGLYLAEKKTPFGKLSNVLKQSVAGILFGLVAILATKYGIELNGAVLNVRNAAPLTAGLVFGWPAGILAGVIGAIHRWTYSSGAFTRLACTVATMTAGLIGAGVRKLMMDDKRATWFYGLTVGITTEVLHMLLIFWTNKANIQQAFDIVQIIALPMILANAISVTLAILAVSWLGRNPGKRVKAAENISQTFQRWLLVSVLVAFGVTFMFTYSFQTNIADANARDVLKANVADVKQDIQDTSNRSLLDIAYRAAEQLPETVDADDLWNLAEIFDLTELNLIDETGRIVASTYPAYEGYHMSGGKQSAAFLVLLKLQPELVQEYQPTSYDASISRKYAGVALERGGFLQIGYDAEHIQRQISEQIKYTAQNRHIGQSGFIILCDEQGVIVSDRNGNVGKQLAEVSDIARKIIPESGKFSAVAEGKIFEGTVFDNPSYCTYTTTEGYYIIGVMSRTESNYTRNASVYMLAFMEIVVFAALFALIFFLIKRLIVTNIRKINNSLAQITGGDLDVMVNVRDNEEFASLSDDINATVATLKHYIDEAAARFDKDLEIAKKIQHSALPSVFPPYPSRKDFAIFASMDAAKEVGGDFYDFYLLDETHLAFVVADVSGKGIPGAMFMMTSKTLIKSHAESGLPVNDVFTHVNAQLCENNEAGMFVTAWMGILDLETGMIRYANAGHNPPVVKHKDGTYTYLKGRVNFVLAGMEGVRYRQQELQLQPGDEIYLYTDGVTEAHNMEKELFGEDRLLQSLNGTDGMSVEQICKKVKTDVDAFVGEGEQFDDITMLCVRLNERDDKLLTVEPTMESVSQVAAFVEEQLEVYEVPMKLMTKLMIAVDEIYSNIVRYSGATTAQVYMNKDEQTLTMTFRDNGKPYNPLEQEDPDITASAEDRAIGGLGIFMVRKMMDRVDYMYKDGQNMLTLVARL